MEICKHLPTLWVLPLQGIVILGSFNFVTPCDMISQKLQVVMMAKKKKNPYLWATLFDLLILFYLKGLLVSLSTNGSYYIY